MSLHTVFVIDDQFVVTGSAGEDGDSKHWHLSLFSFIASSTLDIAPPGHAWECTKHFLGGHHKCGNDRRGPPEATGSLACASQCVGRGRISQCTCAQCAVRCCVCCVCILFIRQNVHSVPCRLRIIYVHNEHFLRCSQCTFPKRPATWFSGVRIFGQSKMRLSDSRMCTVHI